MNFSELLTLKTGARDDIKNTYGLPKRSKILVGICFSESEMTQNILDGLACLPANFIIFGKHEVKKADHKNIVFESDMSSIDFI